MEPKPTLNPTALAKADVVALFVKVGGKSISLGMIEADLAAGAPTNADGTINLIHYAAWLLHEMHRGT
jgi:hypothetical protein